MRANDFISCPRTRASVCDCSGLNKIQEADDVIKAVVQLEHVEGDITGSIVMKQEPGKPTIIRGLIKGLTPGLHGFHVHEFGDLSKGCESAGGHYNPDGVDHGDLAEGHVGDLGNIEANEDGIARFKIVARRIDLSGDRSIVGRAIVIHADEDDLGKGGDEESLKTGNAGERVACGVIRLRQGVEESYQRRVGKKHFDRNQLPQIRRKHIQNSDFDYKEGMISIDKIIPVQTQRVKGLAKKSQDVFLNNEDRPFIVDRKGYLINGHHRFDAANVLGIKKVPAIMIDADIEDVMDKFKDETSDTKVMKENYFKNLLETKMNKPQFDVEWDEAQRYPEFKKLGKDGWVELASKGKATTIVSAKDINNTDAADVDSFKTLDPQKQKRATAQLKSGNVEMPIVAVYSDGHKELIGGNTRLTAMMRDKGQATVWQFVVPDEVATLAEGPKDFDNMNLDQKGKQDSIDYFYHTHAPTFGKPTKAGSFKGHSVVTFKTPDGTLMFLVNRDDQAVFYVGLNKMPDGVAVGNVRSNGTIKATEVYRYLVSKYGKLYSDKHQTPDGRKIWANLAKYNPELKISDTGDRLMATENFADGKVKGKSRPGRVKKAGASCKGSVTDLRAKAKKYSGERGKMYHWCANMKAGKKK